MSCPQVLSGCRLASTRQEMCDGIRLPHNEYSEQSIQFMDKVLEISGLGDETFLPECESPILADLLVLCVQDVDFFNVIAGYSLPAPVERVMWDFICLSPLQQCL